CSLSSLQSLLLFLMMPRPPLPTLFPYTTLFRSGRRAAPIECWVDDGNWPTGIGTNHCVALHTVAVVTPSTKSIALDSRLVTNKQDRKSTRLNSSHVKISYAVFCLKKKTTNSFIL